ncbi:MAG: TonB-dependent receptor [Verrucomicrobiae bacterium]|nr:TonB-dependent receptor [Verrucomicrobiae bacterium]
MERIILNPHQKALDINLDDTKYGSFAEIGAGQEVVRWFFRVGGAAGTVAKSISAYDMEVSDAIYGKCDRYVSKQRLHQMLDHEFNLNVERLADSRGATQQLFAFADTVSARNFKGTNECHGWMGIRFQPIPNGPPSQIVIHVRMWDKENLLQQEALGIVGVNLMFGAFYHTTNPHLLLESLLDSLSIDRIEIDMIEFSGPIFAGVDNRLMSLRLVQLGLTNAAMFAADGHVLQPSEVLYKKCVIVERGSFRPVTHVNLDMIDAAHEQFVAEPGVTEKQEMVLMEITMKNLMATTISGDIDYRDFLARVDLLATTGKTVLISNYFEYYRLMSYLRRYTKEPIGIVMGAISLKDLFDEKYYLDLEGGILEAFGRLFKTGFILYVYPYRDPATGNLVTVDNFSPPAGLESLFKHLIERGSIKAVTKYKDEYLSIFSRDVLAKIKAADEAWKNSVPAPVAELIRKRGYFGCKKVAG